MFHLGGAIVEIGIAIGDGGTVSYAAENERAAPLSNHGARVRGRELERVTMSHENELILLGRVRKRSRDNFHTMIPKH